jgi:hypothetical protein
MVLKILKVLIVIIFTLQSITSFAQKAKDVLYLKNGSVVKGRIVGFDSLDRLKIQTYNSFSMVFPRHEIKRFIIRGNEDSASTYRTAIKDFTPKTRGYVRELSFLHLNLIQIFLSRLLMVIS